MWDNAYLLRNLANALLALNLAAVLFGATYYVMHLPGAFPLRGAYLGVAPQHVDAEQVLRVLRKETDGNLVTVDIERIRQSLERLPWVRGVNIRREFPSLLEVQVEEHQVLARWNENALVNREGEVFVAESDQTLPDFRGPEGTSVEVTRQYEAFGLQLAALDLHASKLTLSPRHAWQIRLSNGTVLELGREDMAQRLARFVAVYPYTEDIKHQAENSGAVRYVDLRYHNGFAVGGG